jgi:hypothetical protein
MFVSCVMLAMFLAGTPYPSTSTDPVIKDFNERVQRYSDLRKRIEDAAPPIDKKREPEAAVILAHEQALAVGIRAARAKAVEGDIFTPAIQKTLIEVINGELSSGTGAVARKIILGEGNPTNPESATRVDLQVNAKYPSKAPLSTVPPSLLLKLPPLPNGIDYRFVGRHLILHDSKANLIVDVLRNAIR